MAFPPLIGTAAPLERPFRFPGRHSAHVDPSGGRNAHCVMRIAYCCHMARIDFFANWKDSDDIAVVKARKAIRNNWRKLRTGSSCCGNHGEPGC